MKSSFLLTALASLSSLAQSATTTVTNTVNIQCLQEQVSSIFPTNLGHTTGFPVVIVYVNPEDHVSSEVAEKPATSTTTRALTYTIVSSSTSTATSIVCSNGVCSSTIIESYVPVTFTAVTDIVHTFAAPTGSLLTSASLGNNESNKSMNSIVSTPKSILVSASTIFVASVTPSTTFKESINTSLPITTQRNPMITRHVVSKSLSVTLDPNSYSTGVIISNSPVQVNGSSPESGYLFDISSFSPETSPILSSESSSFSSSEYSTSQSVVGSLSSQDQYSSLTTLSTTLSIVPQSSFYFGNSSIAESFGSDSVIVSSYQQATDLSDYTGIVTDIPTSITLDTSSLSSSSLSSPASLTEPSISTSSTSTSTSKTSTSSTSTSKTSTSSTSTLSTSTSSTSAFTASSKSVTGYTGDLFQVISTNEPPSVFPREELPLGIPDGVSNNGSPYETNKFFANLFLDSQTDMIWTYPYGQWLYKSTDYSGFAIQHTTASQRAFTYNNPDNKNTANYFGNPTFVPSLIFSAEGFTQANLKMEVTDMKSMSALVTLNSGSSADYIDIPIVQGMGFNTAIYHGNLEAVISSPVGISKVVKESSSSTSGSQKYRVSLFNGADWLIYLSGASSDFQLTIESDTNNNGYYLKATQAVDGLVIQFVAAPDTTSAPTRKRETVEENGLETYYDKAAGMYPTSAKLQGTVNSGNSASYQIAYQTEGSSSSGTTIIFALPHHISSLSSDTSNKNTGITLDSTTKGVMQAYLTNELQFEDVLHTEIQFLPLGTGAQLHYSADELQLLAQTANEELSVDIKSAVAGMDSNYFSGKVIDKYAYILLVVSEVLGDDAVTKSTLQAMKDAFEVFTSNSQYYPLMYDTKFGGVTSTASQGGDTGADFGSGYYNDHHFHYGYFVHAAAVVGYIDAKQGGTWAQDNKEWVNSLVRDVANPSEEDTFFPISRMFDWYQGHSWAGGLFSSGDGKNEESSSEDYNFAYGMKLWGRVIGDGAMESRGNLMLTIMQRAMNSYFYYSDDNTIEPSQYIGNKVSGILFENKIDFSTYFGAAFEINGVPGHPEYVHGIHMMPITPASSLIRGSTFVEQEWDVISNFIDSVDSGWTGVLQLNRALYDPKSSYDFFSSSSFSDTYLDNGQSRTWCLAFSAGLLSQ